MNNGPDAPPLSLEAVSKSFSGKPAVRDLSFTVRQGEIFGFLGPNGAGKTTSLRTALGIMTPDQGRVMLFGAPPSQKNLRRVGFLPEERGLYKKMTAEAVIVFFARLKGMGRGEALKKARALLDQYGLGDVAQKKLKTFSKGMAQKVQILAAIAHDPELVILDEPFSGLDPVNQRTLESLVRGLADGGATVIFSTHVMEHAERLCDRILLLSKGRTVFEGAVSAALDAAPRRVFVETDADVDVAALTAAIPGASAAREGEAETEGVRWRVDLPEGASTQPVLHAFVDKGAPLRMFEPMRTHLHDAFVELVEREDRPS
ncbi:MAG: ATP-binding cassette domain-containing protein [Euryhalocaulis sp.]|uniref:ABC transporter ATP-binding protein n=1 Tax=Euryhalocaulis sp. TaxID=2744307 RepID=UPI0017D9678A|nr:ATP-binding cassette domain-containing protein [Euryhalocaulis sp.]MBA4801424.1 ATP-binding cassette domain-containing protein [Euryhalocaulis sp.]